MKLVDNILAIKNKIKFEFIHNRDNENEIKFIISFLHYQSASIRLNKKEFIQKRAKLNKELRDFVAVGKSKELFQIAEIGYSIFEIIDNALQLQDDRFYNVIWRQEILENISNKNIHSSKLNNSNKYLEITFPSDFHFNVGLLYPQKPIWETFIKKDPKEILGLFFDFRFNILNQINRSEFQGGIYLPQEPLKSMDTINAIHAINKNLVTSLEQECWDFEPNLKRYQVESKVDLVRLWQAPINPRLILFSTHYKEDNMNSFVFSLSKDEFTNFNLSSISSKTEDPKPLLFLNCCYTGVERYNSTSNIFTLLYPKHALGFITTSFEIQNKNAGAFVDVFFKVFMQENITIVDAFNKTKNILIFQRLNPEYASFGYMIWQVWPQLRYESKQKINAKPLNIKKIKRNEKANNKKNKKSKGK